MMNKKFFKSVMLLQALVGTMAYAQSVGNVGINTEAPKATLEVHESTQSNSNEGVIIPNLTKDRVQAITQNEESTLVFAKNGTKGDTNTKTKEITTKGFYYYEGDNSNGKWVRLVSKAQFYMPSIVLETSGKGKTVNLYEKYNEQYGTGKVSSDANAKLRMFKKEDLDYFVTYYDDKVFEKVSINTDGVLTYDVKDGATVTVDTFMNVVLQEK